MKNATLQLVAVLAVFVSLTGLSIAQNSAMAQPTTVDLEWRFDSSVNPAPPELAQPESPGAQASVVPGLLSTGWLQSSLANAQGVWDLGASGTINLSLGTAGSGPMVTSVTVEVWQWIDGSIYADYATASVPGATRTSIETRVGSSGLPTPGDWMVQKTVWQVPQSASISTAQITGAATGSFVDKVTLQIISAAQPTPLVLSISRVGPGALLVSWPVAAGSGTLEWNADLGNPQGWAEVGIQPQISGDLYTVPIQAADTMKFFRVRK